METLSKLKRQAEISSVYDEMVCRFVKTTPSLFENTSLKPFTKKLTFYTACQKREIFLRLRACPLR